MPVGENYEKDQKKNIKYLFDCHGENMSNETLEEPLTLCTESVILHTKCVPWNYQ